MSKHTRGPWTHEAFGEVKAHHDMITVATVRSQRDGQLIAAAPDLLAACKAVQAAENLQGVDARAFEEALDEALKKVSAAVHKATSGHIV